jgi:predicted permease
VSETFFSTLKVPMLLGRELLAGDTKDAPKVVVVNEAFARKYLPDQYPIGQTLKRDAEEWRIVGVCRNIKYSDIKADAPPTVYLPFRQHSMGSAFFLLRTVLPPLSVATAARKVVSSMDPNIPVTDISTQEQVRDKGISRERMFATLCSWLAGLAVLLSCIGLYGLMAYHVTRRSGEIGIRMALGATRWQVAAPVLREAMMLLAAGVSFGAPLTSGLTQLIRSHLYGVQPSDPATLCLAVGLLLVVAVVAAWIPARRAAEIDPMNALRYE